jgi:hypothetical protein
MPTPASSLLAPPKSWDEFEDICADLFSREWGDRNAFRHGRQGQRQNGVDIYGRPRNGGAAAVQCKGRRQWPPRPMTTDDIYDAVAEVRKFEHPLTEFTIATIAPDDRLLQDHALKITRDHERRGLFRVYVTGWGELSRRLTTHDELLKKHFSFVTLSSVEQAIQDLPRRVTEAMLAQVSAGGITITASDRAVAAATPINSLEGGVTQALERYIAQRFTAAIQRTLFPEGTATDSIKELANEVLDGPFAVLPSGLRRAILLRASRSAALRSEIGDARRFLVAAGALPGEESDAPARARLAEASGDVDGAIQILRDRTDADSRSTLLHILALRRSDAAALEFIVDQKISVADLTVNGIHTLGMLHIRQGNVEQAKLVLEAVLEDRFTEGPYLQFLRGGVRMAAVVPRPDRQMLLRGSPLDVRFAQVVGENAAVAAGLDAAIDDFNRTVAVAQELGLRQTRKTAEAYIIWAELLHPARREAALAKLRASMADPQAALALLPFAFAYDPDFAPDPIAKYLEKRESLGGLNDEELKAALVIGMHRNDGRAVADFIAKHRAPLDAQFGRGSILGIEIQALAMAGDATGARLVYDANEAMFEPAVTTMLEAEIAKAEGFDPVAASKRVYESTQTVESLRALIARLAERKDHHALGHYAEILFQRTDNPVDAAIAAKAFANAGDDDKFLDLLRANPIIEMREPELARYHAWKLLQRGQIREAFRITDWLRANGSARDPQLEVALAIESGDWESLATPLGYYLENAGNFSGPVLINAARLAQASGQGSFKDLLDAAAKRAPDDPSVLISAFTMILEEGLEDKKPEAHAWFRRAVDVSGDEGPVKRFELKELLTQHLKWTEYSGNISDAVVKGDLPLAFAAIGLRSSYVELLLGNLVRNSSLADPRKRIALPLFSGRRAPSVFGETTRIGLDISALMVAARLGLLPRIMDSYPEVVIPAGALQELFEGRARIQEVQKSRIERAREIQEAVARGKLKVLKVPPSSRDALEKKIGPDLAALLRAAKGGGGVVVRPAPVKRLGLENDGEADISAYQDVLTDMGAVLDWLVSRGMVDQATESAARNYFNVQDRGWPSRAGVPAKDPMYLDALALIYLQTVDLLGPMTRASAEVFIHPSVAEEADALIAHANQSKAVLDIIDDIRVAVARRYKSGQIQFAPQRKPSGDESDGAPSTATINLIADTLKADVIVVDDRALNKELFITDNNGHRAKLATTLDVIEDLRARGVLSESDQWSLRHRLRAGGALLVPLHADEVLAAALRSIDSESAELRGMRESIGLARIADMPRFPAEVPWFASVNLSIQHALIRSWNRAADPAAAARISDKLLDLRAKPEDWLARWEGNPPQDWAEAVSRVMASGLAVPVELDDDDATRAYNEWLETRVLTPMRNTFPERYAAVANHIRALIPSMSEAADEPAKA